MVTAGDFRNGLTFDDEGNVFQIIEFQHVKPGKGAAFHFTLPPPAPGAPNTGSST